jgi:hypothetical protein
MSLAELWSQAYARQADADLRAWERYEQHSATLVAECHKLQHLQMACEKLCKAYLLRAGTPAVRLQSSHGYIAGPLPLVIREEILHRRKELRGMEWVVTHVRHLAQEIEVLTPSVDRGGLRPDNCEYPWLAGGRVCSPLDHAFALSRLIDAAAGRTFLKLLRLAIDRSLA